MWKWLRRKTRLEVLFHQASGTIENPERNSLKKEGEVTEL